MARWFRRSDKHPGRPVWAIVVRRILATGLATLALALGGVMATGVVSSASAEPTAMPGDKVKARQVRLAARGAEPGTWGQARVRLSGNTESRYFVRGLDVSAPLSVQVIAERLDAPVQVSLHRHTWASAHAEGSTGSSGIYRFDGRAHGDVGVKLRSETGERVRATVLFWQGKPVPPSLAAVYAAPGTPRAAQAGMVSPTSGASVTSEAGWLPWVGGAAIALLLVGVGVWLGRRPRSAATPMLLAMALVAGSALGPAPPALAQSGAKPEQKPPDPFDVPAGSKPPRSEGSSKVPKDKDDAAPKPPAPAADKPPNPFDVPAGSKPPPAPPTPREGKDADAAADTSAGGGAAGAEAPPTPESGDYGSRIEAAEAHVRTLASQVADNRAEIERLRLLLESDRDNEPNAAHLPPMPLSCRPPPPRTPAGDSMLSASESRALDEAFDAAWEQFEECKRCYDQPLADFEAQILLYEKLRALYGDTKKYVTNVITTGDSLAKPHYLLENAWAAQKLDIRVTFAKTGQAYDAKLIEFNDKLSLILDRIGECETSVNNNPMWRRTSGLFFHQTMANSYKRAD
jgi:hypothetical protein